MKPGRPRKYPWEEWFRRERAVLLRGVHYRCSQSTMVQAVRNNASRRGLRVKIDDTDTEITVEVVGIIDRRSADEVPCTAEVALAD